MTCKYVTAEADGDIDGSRPERRPFWGVKLPPRGRRDTSEKSSPEQVLGDGGKLPVAVEAAYTAWRRGGGETERDMECGEWDDIHGSISAIEAQDR